MKKNILLLTIVIGEVFISGNANAQLSKSSETVVALSASKGDYHKTSSSPVAISYRTLKNFNKMFTKTQAAWYETEDVYIAKFSGNSVETMVGYGKRGTWLYTIRRYGEITLPKDVRVQVKTSYFDYTIIHIDEVHVPKQENSIYIIHMRDKKNFKTLRICDNEMDVIEDYHE